MERRLELEMLPQPDDFTCGPTALHAVYRYYGDEIPLQRLISEISHLESGGTVAVSLACHALSRGYDALIETYNLQVFDPTWFAPGVDIAERLRLQMLAKTDAKLQVVTEAYLEYFALGGRVSFEELSAELLIRLLAREQPVLTGLSATYLYSCAREYNEDYDDIRGEPSGHFVVLCGYNEQTRRVLVADPMIDNPRFGSGYYSVGIDRLLGAILLGIITYDANLLLISPRKDSQD